MPSGSATLNSALRPGGAVSATLEFAGIAVAYLILAKLGLQLASINPSATPVWPATGLALAAVLLRGSRVWPAIFVGAVIANVTTTGALVPSAAIALGNTLEALAGGFLIHRWSAGQATFATPMGIARFALIVLAPTTMVSATIGVASLVLAGFAAWPAVTSIWMTWWIGDVTGALIVTPVIVLWAAQWRNALTGARRVESAAILAVAALVGVLAFSPLIEQTGTRDPIGFLAIIPLLWAALRSGQRDTATAALILAGFALWGALAGGGPFFRDSLNDSFLLVLMFVICVSVPSLALSADAATHRATADSLRIAHADIDRGRRQGEQALADSERQFRLLVQGVTDYAIYMLDTSGHISSWNSGAQRIKGYAATEIIGNHFSRFFTEEDRRNGVPERAIGKARTEGKYEAEGWRVRKDGTLFWASVVLDAIYDETGFLIGFAKITRDVTERRDNQEALDRARDQLAQAQKMEAIGQVTGGIAHDFNNLLMIVTGHADILRRRVDDAKLIGAIDAIQAAARRGEGLTRQLLTFSRRQRMSPVVIDIGARLETLRPMLESSLRGNIEFVVNLPDGLWPVEVDVGEFELALVNIAVNARDAMPEGGRFVVSAENVSSTPLSGSTQQTGDYVAIDLTDAGTGIPPEIRTRIFDPFFTTKPVGKGTGLGLSQVHGFAHQSGGTVTIDSKVDVGTTITIYLPRSAGPVQAMTDRTGEDVAARASPASGVILAVEDNPEVAAVTVSLLEQIGYRVRHVDSAAGALAALAEGGDFDLVFSDIVMPGPDGVALAQDIHRLYPSLPVLLTSGYSNAAQHAQMQFSILRKPYEIPALRAAIADALAAGRQADA